jgi:hypothetical protein
LGFWYEVFEVYAQNDTVTIKTVHFNNKFATFEVHRAHIVLSTSILLVFGFEKLCF